MTLLKNKISGNQEKKTISETLYSYTQPEIGYIMGRATQYLLGSEIHQGQKKEQKEKKPCTKFNVCIYSYLKKKLMNNQWETAILTPFPTEYTFGKSIQSLLTIENFILPF